MNESTLFSHELIALKRTYTQTDTHLEKELGKGKYVVELLEAGDAAMN